MRYSREHSEATRARILAAAARLFREKGLDGIGVDAVAAEAGVTSGAIYRAFGSKERLFEAVVQDGIDRLLSGIAELGRAAPGTWPAALFDWYLGPQHVGAPGRGCLLPTLSPDIARGGEAARRVLESGLRRAARLLAESPGREAAAEGPVPPQGWASLSLLVGAVLLARATGPGAARDEILAAARRAAADLAGGPAPARPAAPDRGKEGP